MLWRLTDQQAIKVIAIQPRQAGQTTNTLSPVYPNFLPPSATQYTIFPFVQPFPAPANQGFSKVGHNITGAAP